VVLLALAIPAWAARADDQPASKKTRVLLVTRGNKVLEAFFSESVVGEQAVVKRLKPADLRDEESHLKPARAGAFDLVVFDCCGPQKETDLPGCNTLFIGHAPPPWKMADLKKIENPAVKDWRKKHPLLSNLTDLDKIGIAEAVQLKDLPKNATILIDGDKETPLLVAITRKPHTDLILTFSLVNAEDEWNTNWPLQPSFPLFLAAVLDNSAKKEEPSK